MTAPEQLTFEFPSNPAYQLKNFEVCKENELVYKASLQIVKHPDDVTDLNPLLIIGPRGTGKTHLLHAIANNINSGLSKHKAIIISTTDLIKKHNDSSYFPETSRLSSKYKKWDLLLIDDIHLIEAKHNLQEQIFHIYNDLISRGKRVVITSARSPAIMDNLKGYLRSRLLSGALITIKSGEDSIKLSILKKIARDKYITLSDSSARFITNHYTRDIKKFEDIIQKIGAYSLSLNKKVTIQLIKTIMDSESI